MKDGKLDFSDPAAVRQLSKTLFKVDYHITLELPDNRLCPPVRPIAIFPTKTLTYTTLGTCSSQLYRVDQRAHGQLDVQAAWLEAPWVRHWNRCQLHLPSPWMSPTSLVLYCNRYTTPSTFRIYSIFITLRAYNLNTDIDTENVTWAQKNIQSNDCSDQIKLYLVDKDGPMIPIDKVKEGNIDFTMTNPPFYKSEDEMRQSLSGKAQPPPTACTGAEVEMITEGGEIGFVERIMNESLVLREQVQWYTAMLGYMSSVTAVVEKLRSHGIENYAVKAFIQGEKTRRWAVGWSFRAMRPNLGAARGISGSLAKNLLPAVTEATVIRFKPLSKGDEFALRFSESVGTLQWISWSWDETKLHGIGKAGDRIWSRAWRRRGNGRKKRKHEEESAATEAEERNMEVKHAFGIYLEVKDGELAVRCRWLEGWDSVAFESFTGYLKSTAERIHLELESKA